MATFTVTSTQDSGAGSLREAVLVANAAAGADAIVFSSAFDGGAEDLIRLTSGQIEITDELTITGGPAGVTITGDANGDDIVGAKGITDVAASLEGEGRLDDNSRIFDATAALTIDGLTLTGGRTLAEREDGGAVSGTTVTLIDSTVSGNSTWGDFSYGGGVYGSRVTLTNSTVSGNSTSGFQAWGGGVGGEMVTLTNSTVSGNSTAGYYARGGGTFGFYLTLMNSTVSGNSTTGDRADGGGIYGRSVTQTNTTVSGNSTAGSYANGGGVGGHVVTLTNSTVSGNSTTGNYSGGGGVYGSDVAVTNSTVSGNSTAGDFSPGGGISTDDGNAVTLTSSTVSGNSTAGDGGFGGGVRGDNVILTNSIVLGNVTTFPEVGRDEIEFESVLIRNGGNILGGDLYEGEADVGDVTTKEVFTATTEVAPGVFAGVLADNGGPTQTILIKAGGPAVDAGGATTLPIDQRGLERVVGAAVDLGAVEFGAGPAEPGSLVVTTALDVAANDGVTSLREAVLFANLQPGADVITFDAGVFDGEAGDLIRLTGDQITITDELTISAGPLGAAISGDANGDDVTLAGGITDVVASGADRLADNSRIFSATASLTIDGLTLTGGRTTGSGQGGGAVNGIVVTLIDSTLSGNSTVGAYSQGGGVIGQSVTAIDSAISGNSTAGSGSGGGGVYGFGQVTLMNSAVSGNSTAAGSFERGDIYRGFTTDSGGGGVGGFYVTLIDSTVSGNSTAGRYSRGGGVSGNFVTLMKSTVSGNSTLGDDSGGGGVFGWDDVALIDSTVSGNSTAGDRSSGGGVFGGVFFSDFVGVSLTNSTVSGNSTAGDRSSGGAIAGYYGVSLTNSVVLGNTTTFAGVDGDELEEPVTLTGGNILGTTLFDEADIRDVTAAEVFAATTEIAPGVFAGVLADNGGPTRTIAIRADGPAAGAADPATATETDQRGVLRDEAPDLGAFEAAAEAGLKLVGGPDADMLVGGAGDDRICGRGGNDLLRGLAGGDLLRGGRGCDRLKGGADDDDLAGGRGRDRIGGGTGDDRLSGGEGCDVFVFGSDFGEDEIRDFDANPRCGQDRIDLRALRISAASFAESVSIERRGDDTLVALGEQGSILCRGVDGEGGNVIDPADFLLLG